MKKRFSRKTIEKLKSYVYAYVDRSTEEILYIGMGKGNRAFWRIPNYKKLGKDIRIDILRHGLDDDEARSIESTLIDSLGLDNIDNKVKGSKSKVFGRTSVENIEKTFGSLPIDIHKIKHNGIFFFAHKALDDGCDDYDACRQFWKVDYNNVSERINGKLKFEYAFLMKGNFIEEIYKILEWFPAGSTHSSREYIPKKNIKGKNINRFEFVGKIASPNIQKLYKHKSIIENDEPMLATQGGFKYFEKI